MHCNNGLNNKLVESLVENKVAQETGDLKYLQDSMYDFVSTLKEIILGEYSPEFFNKYVDEALKLHGSNLEEFLKIPEMGIELKQALDHIDDVIDISNQEFRDNLVLLLDRFQTTLDNMEYEARSPYDVAVKHGFIGTEEEWLAHILSDTVLLNNLKSGANSLADYIATIPSTVNDAINNTIISSGFVIRDSFEVGATITQRNEALRQTSDGKLYRWAGDLPKTVASGSTPAGTGGFGTNAWIEVSDASLRSQLAQPTGYQLVGGVTASVMSTSDITNMTLPVGSAISVADPNNGGLFQVVSGDFINAVKADTQKGYFVPLADNPSGSSKVAKRVRHDAEAFDARWFGVSPDNTTNTKEIQAALDIAKVEGGGIVKLPKGTLYISTAQSLDSASCLRMREGVHLKGAGRNLTHIRRVDAERSSNGALILNSGFKSSELYGAEGNMIFSDFSITDGDVEGERLAGNHIGLGNCKNIIIERIDFGNHDQHAVDLSGVDGAVIRDCKVNNTAIINYNGSASIQVDGTGGLNNPTALRHNSKNVLIENNHIVNLNSSILLHLGHKPVDSYGFYENIIVRDNYMEGGKGIGYRVIYVERYVGFKNLVIEGNTLNGLHEQCSLIDMNVSRLADGSDSMRDIVIRNNKLTGKARWGIIWQMYGGATHLSGRHIIEDNFIDIDVTGYSSISLAGILVNGLNNPSIKRNTIIVRRSDIGYTYAVKMGRNRGVTSFESNNVSISIPAYDDMTPSEVTTSLSSLDTACIIGFIAAGTVGDFESNIIVKNNIINLDYCKYAISATRASSIWSSEYDIITASNNMMVGGHAGIYSSSMVHLFVRSTLDNYYYGKLFSPDGVAYDNAKLTINAGEIVTLKSPLSSAHGFAYAEVVPYGENRTLDLTYRQETIDVEGTPTTKTKGVTAFLTTSKEIKVAAASDAVGTNVATGADVMSASVALRVYV